MSKYKVGDKVVMVITAVSKYSESYEISHEFMLGTGFIDNKTNPLSTYTEPLEAKISRQAAEITRLLAENEKLKAVNGNVIWEIEQAFDRGCNEAWELARKCMLMTDRERKAIFGSGHNALYGVLTYFDYEHAAAKVAEWGEKIKIGDVIRAKETATFEFCVTEIDCNGHLYGIGRYGETCNNKNPEEWEKTGRHIDIYGFLRQIGGEE